MLDAKKIVEKRFIHPLLSKKNGNIGVELEFPLLNMDKKPIDEKIANALMSHMLDNGFKIEEKTVDGMPAFIVNKHGDCISFDNSYNNIEFAMQYGDDLTEIAKRFYGYFEECQSFLAKYNYLITGLGTNPYKKFVTQSHVNYPVYNMVDEYLHKPHDKAHGYSDFPAYLSSVQTHLDVDVQMIPKVATLFAQLDFVRAQLFSNSLSFDKTDCLCYRDYLWEKSGFPNTGKVDDEYETLDDIAESYLKRNMFHVIRDGKYISFMPVNLKDFFEDKKYEARETDIEQFLSFRNIEITYRGTLEVRSDCAQPVKDAFAPPAFSLGILYNFEKANELLNEFFMQNHIVEKNSTLRDNIINRKNALDKDLFSRLLQELVEAAAEGLKNRGKGEEALISPLYSRADKLMCPAEETISHLEKGGSIEDIIRNNSKV